MPTISKKSKMSKKSVITVSVLYRDNSAIYSIDVKAVSCASNALIETIAQEIKVSLNCFEMTFS